MLLYSTYLGGTSDDFGRAIAVDSSGTAYVAGYTESTNFPTANPFQPIFAGGAALSALSLGLDDVPASPAASLPASEAAALGAYVTVITKRST